MAELKTKPTNQSVVDYLNSVENERRRQDSHTLLALMREVTGEEPRMWDALPPQSSGVEIGAPALAHGMLCLH